MLQPWKTKNSRRRKEEAKKEEAGVCENSVYYNDVMYFMRIRYFVENEETCNTTDVFVIICRFSIYIFLCKYTLIFLDILKILAIILLPRNKDYVKYNCNIDVVVLNVFN